MNGENLNESDIDNIYEDALIVFLKVIIIGLWRMLIKKNRYYLNSKRENYIKVFKYTFI